MKKLMLGFVLAAFGAAAMSPIAVSTGAYANHDKCKKGYTYNEDKEKCVRKKKRKRKSRGSHG